jgi:hypothetical protein
MNEWQRDVALAAAAFLGGRLTNLAGSELQHRADVRRNVDRLVDALTDIRGDLTGIKDELHEQRRVMETRFLQVHSRIDSVADNRVHYHGFGTEKKDEAT